MKNKSVRPEAGWKPELREKDCSEKGQLMHPENRIVLVGITEPLASLL